MIPVWMCNDLGGIVYVGKNELSLIFSNHVKYTVRLNTLKLFRLVDTKSKKDWSEDKFLVEPFSCDEDGALTVVICVVDSKDEFGDQAEIFRCDLLEALNKIEFFA